MKYQKLQRFISLSMHSALEINNSEKKGMGLKLRKEPPVLWWQVPKQAEAASQLRSNTSFQTCSHSLLVELFDHFSGIDHFHKEVKKRKQHNFFVKRRRALDKKVFEWSLNFCATSCINTWCYDLGQPHCSLTGFLGSVACVTPPHLLITCSYFVVVGTKYSERCLVSQRRVWCTLVELISGCQAGGSNTENGLGGSRDGNNVNELNESLIFPEVLISKR